MCFLLLVFLRQFFFITHLPKSHTYPYPPPAALEICCTKLQSVVIALPTNFYILRIRRLDTESNLLSRFSTETEPSVWENENLDSFIMICQLQPASIIHPR
jgi:hypothetical protein